MYTFMYGRCDSIIRTELYGSSCHMYFSPCRYKTGLVILNGLLCTSDNNEQEIISQYGQDAGVAFWLLGELNR